MLVYLPLVSWSFSMSEASGVRGSARPVEAVEAVWLISGTDTLKTVPVNGLFSITSNPGVYQLIVTAAPGYKDMMLERVTVEEGRMTDVGELLLQKLAVADYNDSFTR